MAKKKGSAPNYQGPQNFDQSSNPFPGQRHASDSQLSDMSAGWANAGDMTEQQKWTMGNAIAKQNAGGGSTYQSGPKLPDNFSYIAPSAQQQQMAQNARQAYVGPDTMYEDGSQPNAQEQMARGVQVSPDQMGGQQPQGQQQSQQQPQGGSSKKRGQAPNYMGGGQQEWQQQDGMNVGLNPNLPMPIEAQQAQMRQQYQQPQQYYPQQYQGQGQQGQQQYYPQQQEQQYQPPIQYYGQGSNLLNMHRPMPEGSYGGYYRQQGA